MKSSIKCKEHMIDLEFFCSTCESLICKACIDQHTEGQHHVQYFEQYSKKALSGKIAEISKKFSENVNTIALYDEKISVLATNLLPNVKSLLATLKEKIKLLEHLEDTLSMGEQQKLVAYLDETIKTIEKAGKPSSLENFVNMMNEISDLQKILKQSTSSGDVIKSINDAFQTFKQAIDNDKSLNSLCDVLSTRKQVFDWTFDPNCKHSSLVLSNNNMTVTKTGGVSHSTIIGTVGFSTGTHIWEVTLTQVAINSGNPGYWTAFGVIDKTLLSPEKSADQTSSFSTSSYIGYLYQMTGSNPCLAQGSKCILTLNCEEGTLSITGSGVDTKSVGSFKGKTMYPFFNLYNTSNSLRKNRIYKKLLFRNLIIKILLFYIIYCAYLFI